MIFFLKNRACSKSILLQLTVFQLLFGFIGCTDNEYKTATNDIIALVVDKEAFPIPLPTPPPKEVNETNWTEFQSASDSINNLERDVRIIPTYFQVDFSKLPKDIPDKYRIPKVGTSSDERINLVMINNNSRHNIIPVDSFIYGKENKELESYTWTLQFSKVFFSKEGNVAALILIKNTGSSGSGIFLGLEKINNKWKIAFKRELETS
jgi:hypothetical protein